MNEMTNLPLAASARSTSDSSAANQNSDHNGTATKIAEKKDLDSKVVASLTAGTLIVRLKDTQTDTLEHAYHLFRKHAPDSANGAILDLQNTRGDNAPQGDEFKKLLTIGKLYGGFLADSGLKLVVLFNPDNSVSELFGALAAQAGGRVLTTSDEHEAHDWLAGKFK